MEKLTEELTNKAWELILEVEELGGMAKAIETGLPKMRIEEAAARKQARIDSGKDVIVGVNRYQLDREEVADLKIHCQLSIVPCQFIGCPYSSLTLWTL